MSGVAARLRDRYFLPENPSSMAGRARARRWQLLLQRFPDFAKMRVLDLGGTPHAWNSVPAFPGELTVVNLTPYQDERAVCIEGDACDPPRELDEMEFDLVYSNSVIEHLGGYRLRRDFADVVNRFAPHHWIQTPARTFPIEPHWLFPGLQFFPVGTRAKIVELWPFGFGEATPGEYEKALEEVLYVELLGAAEMRHLFRESEIVSERLAGLTKSLIAVR